MLKSLYRIYRKIKKKVTKISEKSTIFTKIKATTLFYTIWSVNSIRISKRLWKEGLPTSARKTRFSGARKSTWFSKTNLKINYITKTSLNRSRMTRFIGPLKTPKACNKTRFSRMKLLKCMLKNKPKLYRALVCFVWLKLTKRLKISPAIFYFRWKSWNCSETFLKKFWGIWKIC